MKELCGRTPFRVEEIRLVSAQYFPDIIAEKYYGVEVKSTKENHWTSTGSSIVESTRDKNVENIYMLFGKLGGKTAEFKCRPYEDCLSDIAVTHSPRYLINMELTKEQTIFSKMGVAYDQLRNAPDSIPLPHVVGELLESATLIKNYLLNSDDLDLDISEFRPELMLPNRYEVWLNDIWKRIHQLKPYKRKETIEELGGISLAEWIDRKYTLSVK